MPARNGAPPSPVELAQALHRAAAARLALARAMLTYCRLLAELPAPAQAALGQLYRDAAEALETGRALLGLDPLQLDALAGALAQPTDHAEIRRRAAKRPGQPPPEITDALTLLAAGLLGPDGEL